MELSQESVVEPKVVSDLMAAEVSAEAAYRVENVRVASGMGDVLTAGAEEVRRRIEDDEEKRKGFVASVFEMRDGKEKSLGKLVVLQGDKLRVVSMVDEATRLMEEDERLMEVAKGQLLEAQEEHDRKLELIEVERKAAVVTVEEEVLRKKGELREAFRTSHQADDAKGMKEDFLLVAKLTEVVSNPDLAGALGRLRKEMSASAGVVEGLEAMKGGADATAVKLGAAAWNVVGERKVIDEAANAKKIQIEQKAEADIKVAEDKLEEDSAELQKRISLYERRLVEHTSLKEGSEKELMGIEASIAEQEKLFYGSDEEIKRGEAEIFSLQVAISAQNELVTKLAEAVQSNIEALSKEGREIIDVTQEVVVVLSNSFEETVNDRLSRVASSSEESINLLKQDFAERNKFASEALSRVGKRAEEGLVATGLYEVEDGEVVQKKARGLDMILAARKRQPEVDTVLEVYGVATEKIGNFKRRTSEGLSEGLQAVRQVREKREGEVSAAAEIERVKFTAALASMEAVASSLPHQTETTAEVPQTEEPQRMEGYKGAITAIGKVLGKLFHRG